MRIPLVARAICAWKGHQWLRFYVPGRLALRCSRCRTETPGWTWRLPALPPLDRPQLVPHARRVRSSIH